MGSGQNLRHWIGMLTYAGLSILLIFMAILPLDHLPGALPGPDVLLALTYVWVIRRPEAAPVWLVALVFLLADFLLTRPPGLATAAAVLTTEYIRTRASLTTEVSFVMEWAVAASMMASMLVGSAAVMAVVGAQTPGLGSLMVQLLGTVLVYPLVVVFARLVFGIRRQGAGGLGFGGAR